MIDRRAAAVLREHASHYPIVTLTGPRQSGKSTLCQATFPSKPHVSLEPLDAREYARDDPRGFLAEHSGGAILDEVQHVPGLLSYLQTLVDRNPTPGQWVLTGSQNFSLAAGIAQSLAGRTSVTELLPLSYDEVLLFQRPPITLWDTIWTGGYPRIHDRGIPPDRWLADYVRTYVERDVRQLTHVQDLQAFTTFLRLAAARTSQELNLSELGADAGVSQPTARAWLSLLETSYLCHRLPPWTQSRRKQLVKAPKLHFVDTGLVCWLLDIRSAEQLRHHPLRGALFETWVAGEVLKSRVHGGLPARLYHYRQTRGAEIDLLVERSMDDLVAVECKSGATVAGDQLKHLVAFEPTGTEAGNSRTRSIQLTRRLVYGGDTNERRSAVQVLAWRDVPAADWAAAGASPHAETTRDESA